MKKQDMMKMFTNEVAYYMAEGWVLVPNNTSYSSCVISITLERDGERQTHRIMNRFEAYYNVYTAERINDLTGDVLDQHGYYYLWAWATNNEDNHYIVSRLDMEEIIRVRSERDMNKYIKTTRQFTPTRKLNIAGYKTVKPDEVTITRLRNGYNVHKEGGRKDLLVKF